MRRVTRSYIENYKRIIQQAKFERNLIQFYKPFFFTFSLLTFFFS